MIYKIINLLASLFMVLMTAVMLFGFRKPRRVTFFSSLFSALMSIVIPVIYILITGVRPDLRLTLPFISLGMLLGFIRGATMKLSFVGDQVVGRHSILFLLLWGLSLALNQAFQFDRPDGSWNGSAIPEHRDPGGFLRNPGGPPSGAGPP